MITEYEMVIEDHEVQKRFLDESDRYHTTASSNKPSTSGPYYDNGDTVPVAYAWSMAQEIISQHLDRRATISNGIPTPQSTVRRHTTKSRQKATSTTYSRAGRSTQTR